MDKNLEKKENAKFGQRYFINFFLMLFESNAESSFIILPFEFD